jgi:hypothetical protein
MTLRCFPAVSLLAVVLALACSSESDSGSGSAGGVPIEDLPTKLSDAACAALSDCYGASASTALAGEDCTTLLQAQLDDTFGSIQASIDDGRTAYAASEAQACLDAVRTAGCNVGDAFASESCEAALDGTVESGGDCDFDHECDGAAYCKSSGSCPGACTPKAAVGETCDNEDQCQLGLTCAVDTGRCVALAGAGDLCGGSEGTQCSDGLFCAGQDESTGKAGNCRSASEVLVGEVGEDCEPAAGKLCKAGVSCTLDSLDGQTPVFKCAAIAGSGAACKPGYPSPCPADEYCSVPAASLEGTCTAAPQSGEACATPAFEDTPSICAPYTRCVDGMCHALATIGQSCQADSVCYSDYCVGGKCAAAGACE